MNLFDKEDKYSSTVHLLCSYISCIMDLKTIEKNDLQIINLANRLGFKTFAGSEFDVLSRYYFAAKESSADIIVRITSDCPLIDPFIIDEVILHHLNNGNDFTSNITTRTFPDGMDVEVFNFNTLEKTYQEALLPEEREHVTHYIWKNSNLMSKKIFTAGCVLSDNNYSKLRLTLDYKEDMELLIKLIDIAGIEKNCPQYIDILYNNPELLEINKTYITK
jgi:spore coat polysaccharide biosynthesis protein SpsF (cytidylyltransferase family)